MQSLFSTYYFLLKTININILPRAINIILVILCMDKFFFFNCIIKPGFSEFIFHFSFVLFYSKVDRVVNALSFIMFEEGR